MNTAGLRSIAWVAFVNLLIAAGLLEIGLRAQQRLGPLYDLDLRPEAIMIGLSEQLNHIHLPADEWDRNGIRRMNEANADRCSGRVLFMGDSFMEGLATEDTVPVQVRRFFGQKLGRELCVFNAACSTYSPSIFVPQAKQLIPLLKPDVVVIDVDETDLYDDYYRYRELATRDAEGSIVAVRRTPVTVLFQRGLIESTSKLLYLHRFVSKLYFTRIEYPKAFSQYNLDKPLDMFWASRLAAPEAAEKYGKAIDYFKATLDDLTRTVLSRSRGADDLVFIHHPHLEHLKSTGQAFNDVVSAAVQEVASRHNVRYYDATADLSKEFGSDPERYYIPNDMHFNPAGLRAYGVAVARYLAAQPIPDSNPSKP